MPLARLKRLAVAAAAGLIMTAVAPAAVADPDPSAEPAASMLTVSIERSDDLTTPVYVGDKLQYTVTYTNASDQALTAYPADGNLDGLLPPSAPNCRWANLAPGDTKQCTSASHTVTDEDLAAGEFTAMTSWKATADRDGATVLQDGITADAEPVEVQEGERAPREDPATVPTDRADGEAVRLARAGEGDFACYRIPALTEAPNGDILAA